jgi:hypothetical protein
MMKISAALDAENSEEEKEKAEGLRTFRFGPRELLW